MRTYESPYVFEHALPEHVLCEAATLLLDEFVADGGEPEGLDYRHFLPAAVGTWVDDRVQRAEALGLSPTTPCWSLMANGDARVSITFPNVQEPVLFKLVAI